MTSETTHTEANRLKKVLARLFLVCSLGLFLGSAAQAQTDVYLRVYSKTFQRMQVDLYPFVATGQNGSAAKTGDLIAQVLGNDLWMSGFFKVNHKRGNPPAVAKAGKSDTDGRNGALAWIAGEFQLQGNRLRIKPHVVDAASGKTILRFDYTSTLQAVRGLVHQIADDIVYRLTGERGIARSKIAYVTQTPGGAKEIAVMDYDGANSRILTADASIDLSPAWSPDGSQICYTSFKDDNPNLYIINLRTGTQRRLSNLSGLNTAPAWSPDGERIALTLSKDGNAELYLLDVERKKLRRLTYNHAIDSSPSWSPSNREIAFTSDRSGSPQIYIMDTDGTNVRRLTFEGSYNDSPVWSPRGDKIAYVSRTDSGFDIYSIDVTGENNFRLTDRSGSNEDPSWAPNGFSLVFSSTRSGKRELYSMFWDGSDQKKLTTGGPNYSPAWSSGLVTF